jgi:hypothetical protein
VDRYQRTLMPLAPQSPPEAGEREAKPICCPPGGIENPGRSSLLKIRHELTYLVVPVIGMAFAGLLGLAAQPTNATAEIRRRRASLPALQARCRDDLSEIRSVGEPFRSRSKNFTTAPVSASR